VGVVGGTFEMKAFMDFAGWPADDENHRVALQKGLVVSLLSLGAVFGAFPAGYIADKYVLTSPP
jgi:MFS family permease